MDIKDNLCWLKRLPRQAHTSKYSIAHVHEYGIIIVGGPTYYQPGESDVMHN